MVLNCVILGNDPEGFDALENYLSAIPFVYLVCRCNTMDKARYWLETQTIDVLLIGRYEDLAVPAPEYDNVLPVMMMVYPDSSPGSYDFLPAALLQQPFTQDRLYEVFIHIHNIIDMEGTIRPARYTVNYFMLRTQHRYEKIFYEDLQYVEVMDDYILLHLKEQKLVTTETLDWIMAQLPTTAFMRVHRWYVIGFRHITHLDQDHVVVGNARIGLTKDMRKELSKRYQLPM
ncbi:LytR/AlgR family response regulator transcription factor [Chitinophaga sp. 30R24]|uniref:LytR/AlgR family response regulator transcription factor n=1 Tax=Chitinophaga sp. 30R24 TaxID=3248838 RepID=UPI003B912638